MINSLQALRAFASIAVVLYHINLHYWVDGKDFLGNPFMFGYAGVDLFFVLSGFVMHYTTYAKNKENEPIAFIKKRLIRIYPSYWIFLLIPLFLLSFFSFTGVDRSNFYFPEIINQLFLFFDHQHITQVTWTLSFELYFYILFFFGLLIKKPILVFSLSFVFLSIPQVFNLSNTDLNSYYLNPIIYEFLMGIVLSYIIFVKKWLLNSKIANLFLLITIIIGVFLIVKFNTKQDLSFIRNNRVIIWGGLSSVLIYALYIIELNGQKFKKIFIDLGDASYIIYLIHSPMIGALFLIIKKQSITMQYVGIISFVFLLLITSILLHKKIEVKMNRFLTKRFLK